MLVTVTLNMVYTLNVARKPDPQPPNQFPCPKCGPMPCSVWASSPVNLYCRFQVLRSTTAVDMTMSSHEPPSPKDPLRVVPTHHSELFSTKINSPSAQRARWQRKRSIVFGSQPCECRSPYSRRPRKTLLSGAWRQFGSSKGNFQLRFTFIERSRQDCQKMQNPTTQKVHIGAVVT